MAGGASRLTESVEPTRLCRYIGWGGGAELEIEKFVSGAKSGGGHKAGPGGAGGADICRCTGTRSYGMKLAFWL